MQPVYLDRRNPFLMRSVPSLPDTGRGICHWQGRAARADLCSTFSLHILVIDHFSPLVDGVKMSCIQFLTGGILGAVFMLLFENPSIAMILSAAGPILYTGIMSTGVGYTCRL